MAGNFENKWEKRWHPLREEWVVYSAHRNSRPWQGAERIQPVAVRDYDPSCYLCPGNKRIHGDHNPAYEGVFIFQNDHPVVGMHAPGVVQPQHPNSLYKKDRASGLAKVICYDPRHDITLSQMTLDKVAGVFEAFRNETLSLANDPAIHSVLIFENKGEAVGVSNPHPHCQIYAIDFAFKFVEQQIRISEHYRRETGRTIFDDIIQNEVRDEVRIVAENEEAIAFIPYFARYAYEVMIFPKRQHQSLVTLETKELRGLASVFHQVVRRLDMNFDMNFPYVMSVMQAPVDGGTYDMFRMHLWLQPPYRQPGLIKYLAGPEIGAGNFMADTMPEEKAAELRKLNLDAYTGER